MVPSQLQRTMSRFSAELWKTRFQLESGSLQTRATLVSRASAASQTLAILLIYLSLKAALVHAMRRSTVALRISSVLLNVSGMVWKNTKLCLRQFVSSANTRWRTDPPSLMSNWYLVDCFTYSYLILFGRICCVVASCLPFFDANCFGRNHSE